MDSRFRENDAVVYPESSHSARSSYGSARSSYGSARSSYRSAPRHTALPARHTAPPLVILVKTRIHFARKHRGDFYRLSLSRECKAREKAR